MMAGIFDHLWQSTLFACGAGLLTLALRRNGAHIRYWLWLAASVKFLIPFSLLTKASGNFTRPLSPALAIAPSTVDAVAQVAQPFSFTPAPVSVTATAAHPDLTAVLFVVWALGVVAVLTIWFVRWSRIMTAVRAAVPLSLPGRLAVPVKSSASVMEPGLVGIWRPVLLLPEGIAAHLSASEINAILAHELCHMRRRDNLTAALHMLVEAAFWFHPLVWWLGARLVVERERACDEAVLASGSDPATYAEGILKVCRFYVQSPLACASGVSGSDLNKRVEDIMINRVTVRVTAVKKVLLATAAAIALAAPVAVGLVAPRAAAQEQKSGTAQVTGKWAADEAAPNRTYNHIVLDLKVEGGKLTGKYEVVDGPQSTPVQFRDATVSGSKISFLMSTSTDKYGELTMKNRGEVKGDQLVLNREVVKIGVPTDDNRNPAPLVFKRVAAGEQPTFATPPKAEQIAQMQAEQKQPRTAVPLDPKEFDKYVGFYQLAPNAFFTVTRRDDHFLSRLTNQPEFDIYPESPTKFFYKVMPAQLSFVSDAQGNVTELVLHQNGLEQHARKVDESVAKAADAALQKRIADGKPDPERQDLLTRVIAGEQKGVITEEIMSPGLIAAAKQQWPMHIQTNQRLGKFVSMQFLHVDLQGWDVYDATYENGHFIWSVGPLTADHKLAGVMGR